MKITKEFFRCKGNSLNLPYVFDRSASYPERIADCGGGGKHSLPLKEGKEFVYPILTDLLNYLQGRTGKKVIITSGHRCPKHNRYIDSNVYNQSSKHQIGAEVDFYIEGLESSSAKIVDLIMLYYTNDSSYSSDYQNFKRYEGNTNVSTQPWYNKEIFIKLFKSDEGRNWDTQHTYPYISIQVRYDRHEGKRVLYSWHSAFYEYFRY